MEEDWEEPGATPPPRCRGAIAIASCAWTFIETCTALALSLTFSDRPRMNTSLGTERPVGMWCWFPDSSCFVYAPLQSCP